MKNIILFVLGVVLGIFLGLHFGCKMNSEISDDIIKETYSTIQTEVLSGNINSGGSFSSKKYMEDINKKIKEKLDAKKEELLKKSKMGLSDYIKQKVDEFLGTKK